MISRSSFIPSCRARALQRNRCQSQYEEAPRFGLMSEASSSAGFPLVFAIFPSPLLSILRPYFSLYFFPLFFFLFSFVSFVVYLSTYLFRVLPLRVRRPRTGPRGRRTCVRVRSFLVIVIGARGAGRRVDASFDLFDHSFFFFFFSF